MKSLYGDGYDYIGERTFIDIKLGRYYFSFRLNDKRNPIVKLLTSHLLELNDITDIISSVIEEKIEL